MAYLGMIASALGQPNHLFACLLVPVLFVYNFKNEDITHQNLGSKTMHSPASSSECAGILSDDVCCTFVSRGCSFVPTS